MSNTFLKSDLKADLGKNAAQRSLLHGRLVHVFVEVRRKTVFADTNTLSDADFSGETSLCRKLHNQDLLRSEETVQVAISTPKNQEPCKTRLCLYPFDTNNNVPETLRDFYTSGYYTEASRAMRAVSISNSSEPVCVSGGGR